MINQRKNGKAVGALSVDDRFTELEMPILKNASVSTADFSSYLDPLSLAESQERFNRSGVKE